MIPNSDNSTNQRAVGEGGVHRPEVDRILPMAAADCFPARGLRRGKDAECTAGEQRQ